LVKLLSLNPTSYLHSQLIDTQRLHPN